MATKASCTRGCPQLHPLVNFFNLISHPLLLLTPLQAHLAAVPCLLMTRSAPRSLCVCVPWNNNLLAHVYSASPLFLQALSHDRLAREASLLQITPLVILFPYLAFFLTSAFSHYEDSICLSLPTRT